MPPYFFILLTLVWAAFVTYIQRTLTNNNEEQKNSNGNEK
jgi:hypothetical protein